MSTSVSSVVSHFPSAENGFTTTTSGSVSSGAATVGLNSVAGYANGEIAVFVIDPSDASKKQTFTGTIDTGGVQVTGVVWTAGTNQTHSAGATVVDYATATHISMVSKGILVEHNQNGTHSAITATSVAVSGATTLTGALTVKSYDGWITSANTWVYTSGTGTNVGTVTISGVDLTGSIQPGDRVSITQTTAKYAIVTKVAFSTDTVITLYFGTDYTIANAAITLPKYSHDKNPIGFNSSPAKWTVTTTSTTDRSTASASYATLTETLVVPIGVWDIRTKIPTMVSVSATSAMVGAVTLSTDASTETNPELTGSVLSRDSGTGASYAGGIINNSSFVTLAASTTFTLMGKTNAGTLLVRGSTETSIVLRAICAYL